jgi:NTE family protein
MSEVSIAMSSTGFKFPAHVGVIEALDKAGLKAIELSGSSGGALIAGLYATGVPTHSISEWALKTSWLDFFEVSPLALLSGGLVDLSGFIKHLDQMMYGARLGDLSVDLKITACDMNTHSQVILSKETFPRMKVAEAVGASIAIPVLFTPLKYCGMTLSDGAIMNTMPSNLLTNLEVPRLAARVTYPEIHHAAGEVSAPWWIAKRALYMMVDRGNSWAVNHHAQEQGIQLVDIDTGFTDGLHFLMPHSVRDRLRVVGLESTARVLAKKGV